MVPEIKNMQYVGRQYFEALDRELPVYQLKDISDEEWNRRAEAQQTAMQANGSAHAMKREVAACV